MRAVRNRHAVYPDAIFSRVLGVRQFRYDNSFVSEIRHRQKRLLFLRLDEL